MKRLLPGLVLLFALAVTTYYQADQLRQRPLVLKLGPVPHASLLKALAGEHRAALAFRSVVQVMFYFGSFFDAHTNRIQQIPEYASMFHHLENAVRIDPYNMDAYYFSQAAFTWEVGHAKDVNALLDYGMRYRTWDYWMPFYAGFNAAYFLKDYASAARYMQTAAEISNNSLFSRLAARYFHEAGEAELGLVFLETMAEGAKSERFRKIYAQRIEAFQALRLIEKAVADYMVIHKTVPVSLQQLIEAKILAAIPTDPYGGEFYLETDGKVRSTSKFAIRPEDSDEKPGRLDADESIDE